MDEETRQGMLTQLRDIVEKVANTHNLIEAMDQLVSSTCTVMNVECCSVYIADPVRQQYVLMATKGLLKPQHRIVLRFDEGLVGQVGVRCEPINVADAHLHPKFKILPELGEQAFCSFLGTPIIHQRQLLGVLVIQQRERREFTEIEESFLVTLSAQLGATLAHSKAQGMWIEHQQGMHFTGVPASSGIAIAKAWWDDEQPCLDTVLPASCLDCTQEESRLLNAIDAANNEFRRLRTRFDPDLTKETLAIFDLFSHLLNDPMLRQDLLSKIHAQHMAEWAVRQVIESYALRFSQMADLYLKARSHDIRELGQRLLYFLQHSEKAICQWDQPRILFVRELTTAMIASIPRSQLSAVVAQEGAANSHAAILSRALGIPAVMGVDFTPEKIQDQWVIVDGYRGDIILSPNRHVKKEYQRLLQEEYELTKIVSDDITRTAYTEDHQRIEVHVNAGLNIDSQLLSHQGIDGIGLYRTEVPFLLHSSFPSEDEQIIQYREVLSAYKDKRVIMRTLDIGGDKPLPYFRIEEDNPFLGWRGIRFTLDHPEIFLIQIRSMLKASIGLNNLDILLPMISNISEFVEAKHLIDRAYQEISQYALQQGHTLTRPRLGIMIEVPSMLYQLSHLQNKVDFVSVGSNDLTQYLLAVDRNNARVAGVYDAFHPAVLHALRHIQVDCQKLRIPISICGELAGDPMGAILLVGLGYRTLSMNLCNIPKIKYILRHVAIDEMEALAQVALSLPLADDVRRIMTEFIEDRGLGGFIRAGK